MAPMQDATLPAARLVIPADATIDLNHATTATASIPVSDTGASALRVTASVADYTKHAQQFPGAKWVTGISPRTLVIQPGHTGYFKLTIHVPPGAAGPHYTNLIAKAAPAGSNGSAALAIAVGGTLKFDRPGHTAALPAHHLTPVYAPPASTAHAGWMVAVAVAALAVAGLAVAGWRRWQRSRRALADSEMRGQFPTYNGSGPAHPARHRTR